MAYEKVKSWLRVLHKSSYQNKQWVELSKQCGCFHCEKIFDASEVKDWCDKSTGKPTALCPYCGIDSVICDRDGGMVAYSILRMMNIEYFGGGIDKATPEMLTYIHPETGEERHIALDLTENAL